MREHGVVTSLQIATQAMRDKGPDPKADSATRADFVRRVTLQLDEMQRNSEVEKLGRGRGIRWKTC
jgi:hypothetical protein